MGCIVYASLGSNPLSLTGDLESFYEWLILPILMGPRFASEAFLGLPWEGPGRRAIHCGSVGCWFIH